MAGDETELKTLKERVGELEAELATTKHELDKSREEVEKGGKALAKTQRQLDKSNSYNNDLRQQIETLSREIQEFRASRRDMLHVGVQAVAEEILTEQGRKPLPQWENGDTGVTVEEAAVKPSSIAETLKQTAEAALAQSGFVFDDNTGLYYDYNSGYYYNCEQGLYYDPASGTYFYYDAASGEYTFHSQVAPQQYTCPTSQSAVQGGKEERKRKKRKEKKKERDSEDRKKKRKREKMDEDVSKSRRKSKKKSKKRKHRSRHKKGDNSVRSNSDIDFQRGYSEVPKDRKKHSCSKDEQHTSEKLKKSSKVKDDKSKKMKKSKKLCGKDVDMLATKDSHDDYEGEVGDGDANEAGDGDVEMGEIVDSQEEGDRTEATEQKTSGDKGNLSPNSLATGESELESGELTSDTEDSSSSSSSESSEEEMEEETFVVEEEQDDVSGSWPPCIRVMVTESDCLPEGTLFIVTCDGATIGREKDMNHLIRIPDINVSKIHAEIQYDYDAKSYVVIDVGSQNGTFLNSKCMSETKSERSMRALSHGDILQMGSTTLLLHIHPGTDTCDDCEPGQVLGRLQAQERANREVVIQSKADRQKEARHQLKQIKKRYGLENSAYVDNVSALKNPEYQDKAATRRREVGSDNPHVRDEAPASVMQPISTENKGRKLLAKMGWKEGQGLGKDNAGIAEPINVMLRTNQSAGLGSSAAVQKTLDDVQSVKKSQRWLQAQQRYNKLEKGPVDVSKPTNISFAFKKGPTVTSIQPKVDLGTGESDEEGEQPE